MKTLFELKRELPSEYISPCDVAATALPAGFKSAPPALPELSEVTVERHYSRLARASFGVDDGAYLLGSCTMKYNPKLNEAVAALKGFTDIHPLAPEEDAAGAMELMFNLEAALNEITGMDAMTFQPAAGAHGEYTGLKIIDAYHKSRGEKRTKVLVPDSAHGTNPASAAMCGFEVVNIPSAGHEVDLDALRTAVGEDTAALMLTNPTTLGLFERNIEQIRDIVHEAGGLLYYDGANLNAIMGVVRPGDMGFDVVHLNLHKTFSTPHGGGGPGAGPVGVKAFLKEFLPSPVVVSTGDGYAFAEPARTIGKVNAFYGNFSVLVKAYAYILSLGKEGIPASAKRAVLNANYLKKSLEPEYPAEGDGYCMHEFVVGAENLKKERGVTASDLAKGLIDAGIHPPTVYFPLTVHEAMMFEPTETENKDSLDRVAFVMKELYRRAEREPECFKEFPLTTPISRPDELKAAKELKLTADMS